jgi:hypothetical protein
VGIYCRTPRLSRRSLSSALCALAKSDYGGKHPARLKTSPAREVRLARIVSICCLLCVRGKFLIACFLYIVKTCSYFRLLPTIKSPIGVLKRMQNCTMKNSLLPVCGVSAVTPSMIHEWYPSCTGLNLVCLQLRGRSRHTDWHMAAVYHSLVIAALT